eukprot:GHVP01059957.1.p2 GENE.GHVP01059957.1~~GHVP01059957.1.p2  ORF type:complete len:264 (+),score=64.64 GHVP01059957.1:2987-3778(+)
MPKNKETKDITYYRNLRVSNRDGYEKLFESVESGFSSIKDNVTKWASLKGEEVSKKEVSMEGEILKEAMQIKGKRLMEAFFKRNRSNILHIMRKEKELSSKKGNVSELIKSIEESGITVGYVVIIGVVLFHKENESEKRKKDVWSVICKLVSIYGKEQKDAVNKILAYAFENIEELACRASCFSSLLKEGNKLKDTKKVTRKEHRKAGTIEKGTNKRRDRQEVSDIRKEARTKAIEKVERKKEEAQEYKDRMRKLQDDIARGG